MLIRLIVAGVILAIFLYLYRKNKKPIVPTYQEEIIPFDPQTIIDQLTYLETNLSTFDAKQRYTSLRQTLTLYIKQYQYIPLASSSLMELQSQEDIPADIVSLMESLYYPPYTQQGVTRAKMSNELEKVKDYIYTHMQATDD